MTTEILSIKDDTEDKKVVMMTKRLNHRQKELGGETEKNKTKHDRHYMTQSEEHDMTTVIN